MFEKRYCCRWGLLALLIFVSLLPGSKTAVAQTEDESLLARAETLLASMTPAERVGQLFLVTFPGDTARIDSAIADLILNDYIGGVVLLAANDNITGYGTLQDVPMQVAALTNDLQRLALLGITSAEAETADPTLDENAVPPTRPPSGQRTAVPLLIATAHEGDGYPYSQIWNGLTQVPSNLALGATWQPEQAAAVGQIVGQELNALGINMLFGPSLDVLEDPSPSSESDLGTRTFGGDPYWVGLMGQAYTGGVHQGSHQRIAVVPKHFPGYGSSDRALHVEVPTVRKSLQQLLQIELAPFFALTDPANAPRIADALLTSHIRYQGFQGNIRATTNPVSFDQQALTTLLSQAQIAEWRAQGGVMVSDALGVRAVERFYDDTGQEFPHRLIAKDAFAAGNDLLYLGQFALGQGNFNAELANIKDAIAWFQERYEEDISFQQQVDTAVLRILRLKLRLYGGDIAPSNVLIAENAVPEMVNQQADVVFDVAQQAITLISPTAAELTNRLPQPPTVDDNIVIFTDVQLAQQCSFCPEQPLIAPTAIADRMLSLYGPRSSGQLQPEQISSFTFADLGEFLAAGPGLIPLPEPPLTATAVLDPDAPSDELPTPLPTLPPPPAYQVQQSLLTADWIIFGMLDQGGNATALTNFLAERPDLVRNNQVIVFAFNAPYYLDTTQISQLTAYIGVYSKSDMFIDAAIRVLFQEIPFEGASPVDIDGVRYELFTQTQPDPNQRIELSVVDLAGEPLPLSGEPLNVSVGDTLRLQTAVIVDHNGNPVPDNTLVRFIQRDRVQGLVSIIDEVPTINGVAQLDYVLEARTEAGQFQITAESGAATISVQVNISVGSTAGQAQLSVSTPIPQPTATAPSQPTAVPSLTAPPSVTQSPTNTPASADNASGTPRALNITLPEMQTLLLLLVGLGLVAGLSFLWTPAAAGLPHLIGRLFWGLVGGLLLYIYVALGLPATAVFTRLGSWAGLLTSLLGGLVGLLLYRYRHPNDLEIS